MYPNVLITPLHQLANSWSVLRSSPHLPRPAPAQYFEANLTHHIVLEANFFDGLQLLFSFQKSGNPNEERKIKTLGKFFTVIKINYVNLL